MGAQIVQGQIVPVPKIAIEKQKNFKFLTLQAMLFPSWYPCPWKIVFIWWIFKKWQNTLQEQSHETSDVFGFNNQISTFFFNRAYCLFSEYSAMLQNIWKYIIVMKYKT